MPLFMWMLQIDTGDMEPAVQEDVQPSSSRLQSAKGDNKLK